MHEIEVVKMLFLHEIEVLKMLFLHEIEVVLAECANVTYVSQQWDVEIVGHTVDWVILGEFGI